jgi:precorrin-2/cobalt-factor-2 C20-methyltransferase
MHLHVRLAHRFPTEVIPGVTAMSGCWSATGLPIVQGDDVLSVLPGTMDEEELTRRLADTDAAVIMKVGRNLPKIRRALEAAGRLGSAIYVERGTMQNAASMRLAGKRDDEAPYFALVLVPGWEDRP